MNVLPKAIRSSIAHYLFLPIVQNVSLFRGVSRDLLFQLVLEMEAEYYPSKEDVILQNESQTYFYIVVSGALIIGQAVARESFGERGFGGFDNVDEESDPSLVFNNSYHVSKQDRLTNPSDLISIDIQTLEARTKKQVENESESGGREHHIVLDHSVVPKGHIEMAPSLPERRWKEDQLDTEHGENKSIHEEQNVKLIILPDTLEELFILVKTRRTDNDS
ncbi:hypothetical protein KY285_022214 [Solanum tuberosum]|nr:hypothetical protein KY289_020568 [Solanum tuberosum]KAH0695117.1 hypothetical protein KY285_022214 [Solanum tuberosum]